MHLAEFVKGIIVNGEVTVEGSILPFDTRGNDAAVYLLNQLYNRDIEDMPYTPPAFDADAALWGAQQIYLCTQLIVLRNLGAEEVETHLTPYQKTITPAIIYSADLMLRYLPQLHTLAKGLAPADILVAKMNDIAAQWPFSSVGIELTEIFNSDIILAHPALKYAYIDRIITARDLKRTGSDERIKNIVKEALGGHAEKLWPQFALD